VDSPIAHPLNPIPGPNFEPRALASPYLQWAKLRSPTKYDLATSAIMNYPLSSLPVSMADLEINGPTIYGYEPLQERLARKCAVDTECIVATNGTSMANHLVMAATLSAGDDVLIERPAYGPLLEVASFVGANVVRFDRLHENDFQIDPQEIERKLTPKTRLIVLSNLHNPSGAFTDKSTLIQIREAAAKTGAWILVDEVYLDMTFDLQARSCFHLGGFIVTSSLTKTYGLNGLRCGWIVAPPALAERIWKLSDLFGNTPVHPGELLSVIALDHLNEIAERARRLLQINRGALDHLLDGRSDLEVFRPQSGTIIFPRLKHGSVDEFCRMLRVNYDTSVVPGRFFEMPEHIRVGIGGGHEMTAKGLLQLSDALDEYKEIRS
jgi:aspartate/methionine/tyrosine aminotransferase